MIATHGQFDEIGGLGGVIALAPSGKDDELLTAEEILTTMKQHPNPRDWAAFTLIGEAE